MREEEQLKMRQTRPCNLQGGIVALATVVVLRPTTRSDTEKDKEGLDPGSIVFKQNRDVIRRKPTRPDPVQQLLKTTKVGKCLLTSGIAAFQHSMATPKQYYFDQSGEV